MELIINHQSVSFQETSMNIEELVQKFLKGNTSGLAVAINQKVIPKGEWQLFTLKDKDQILLITATQGG